jgi:hypothetical protein
LLNTIPATRDMLRFITEAGAFQPIRLRHRQDLAMDREALHGLAWRATNPTWKPAT